MTVPSDPAVPTWPPSRTARRDLLFGRASAAHRSTPRGRCSDLPRDRRPGPARADHRPRRDFPLRSADRRPGTHREADSAHRLHRPGRVVHLARPRPAARAVHSTAAHPRTCHHAPPAVHSTAAHPRTCHRAPPAAHPLRGAPVARSCDQAHLDRCRRGRRMCRRGARPGNSRYAALPARPGSSPRGHRYGPIHRRALRRRHLSTSAHPGGRRGPSVHHRRPRFGASWPACHHRRGGPWDRKA